MGRPNAIAAAVPGILRRGPVVLLYHRVSNAGDTFRLGVTKSHFEQHLDVLTRRATIMRLADLSDPVSRARLPRSAVAVTFDDGYADNLHVVKPLLEKAGVPASIFVTTGWLGQEFWWDALERILLTPPTLPDYLEMVLGGRKQTWHVPSLRTRRRRYLPIRIKVSGPKPAAKSLLHLLHPLLRDLEEEDRARAMAGLERWAGGKRATDMVHRSLTEGEIAELSASQLVAVGGHTVTHRRLASLPAERQRQEIRDNLNRIEEITGRRPDSFAYPYGQPGDQSSDTLAILDGLGVRRACIASPGLINRHTDPLRLPRIWVEDWDGEGFERWLLRLIGGR